MKCLAFIAGFLDSQGSQAVSCESMVAQAERRITGHSKLTQEHLFASQPGVCVFM